MSLDIITHKNILIKILKDIFTDHGLGPILGFKGGTAAYLFYDLNRFSVDLDFDLLEESKENFVFDEVRKILEKYGTVKEADKKRFNLFYMLSYDDKSPGAQNIKVEINRRDFGSTPLKTDRPGAVVAAPSAGRSLTGSTPPFENG